MSVLTPGQRKAAPKAGPNGSFPIPDVEHGRKALQLDTHKPPAERRAIAAKVHAAFPSIGSSQMDPGNDGDEGPSPAVSGLKQAAKKRGY